MLLRKNTKPFKTILHIVTECARRADREKLIRLYITKAGQSIHERISVDAIQGDAAVFYEMGFETIVSNLDSSTHQLHASDDVPGIYFFRSNLSKSWDECPFEFDDAILKEFKSIPNLPATRKKEKTEKFVLPTPNLKSEREALKVTKPVISKSSKKEVKVKESRQPNFKLKHKIQFTDLDTIIFKRPKVSKEDILNYYDKMSEYILPHLKDRHQFVRTYHDAFRKQVRLTPALFLETELDEMPDWIKTSASEETEGAIIVSDKEHLLACVERGSIEFSPDHSRIKTPNKPDYVVIAIDSPEYDIAKAVDVARASRQVLVGLKLPSFIKTDGKSGLHIHIPLDAKSSTPVCNAVGEFICKLILLKVPELVVLHGTEDYTYGKVTLNFMFNETDAGVVAPYSLVSGETGAVATPLYWEELDEELNVEAFNCNTMLQRIHDGGDPFAKMNKKVNAEEALDFLKDTYGFLL